MLFTCYSFLTLYNADPVIVQGPVSQAAVVEEAVELSCIANYTDTIEWLKDGSLVSSSLTVVAVETEDDDVLQSILSFNATLIDSGEYVCNASNGFGYVLSNTATITILCKSNTQLFSLSLSLSPSLILFLLSLLPLSLPHNKMIECA